VEYTVACTFVDRVLVVDTNYGRFV